MAMVVKNNMSAVSTLNTLNKNSSALQKSLSKVSSGMKINSAQDDASGYAISERMRVQIRSLDQANQNTQNGSSMMKTAEGAVSSTVEILKSLKEKAINSANDTNTDSDRVTIQKELDQFIDQIDDNALTTFNGKYLVDGSKSQQGVATFTSMTNQSLSTATTGSTKLTGLANRNNESLEIASTDYVTASFVKNGKTYTTKFNVGTDADLNKVFSKMTDEYEAKEATTTNPTPEAFGTEKLKWDDASDTIIQNAVDYLTQDVSVSELESYLTSNSTTNTKLAQAVELAAQKTSLVDDAVNSASTTLATEVANAVTGITGPLKSTGVNGYSSSSQASANITGAEAVVSIGTTPSTAWTFTAASGGNPAQFAWTTGKSSVSVTYGASATDSAKKLSDPASEVGTAVISAVKTSAETAVQSASYSAGSVKSAINAADTLGASATITTTGSDNSGGTGAIGPSAQVTATVTSTTDALTDSTVEKMAKGIIAKQIASNLTSDNATLEAAKTGTFAKTSNYVMAGSVVGTNASGDDVTTADGTTGLTIKSAAEGVQDQISGVTISITDSEGNVKKAANAALDNFRTTIYAKNASDRNELSFQVGAAANQAIAVGLEDMRSEALGLKSSDGTKVSVATQDKANAAIAVFDNAIQKALDQQTTIGAIEARLEYTSNNLTTSSENVQAAESTIRDADMAKEMTNYTKNNVLLQAAQSMLAQANQSSSAVLSLLQ